MRILILLVKGDRIVAAGSDVTDAAAREIALPDTTLVPGLMKGGKAVRE